jgi:hypothetical protein
MDKWKNKDDDDDDDTAVLHRLHDYGHLLEEWFTKTTLSDNNSNYLTACYLPK